MYSYQYSFLDILAPIILLPLCYIIYGSVFKRSREVKFFMLNIHWHVGVSIFFTMIYLNVLGGGDTLAYFNTIKCLNNLALHDFFDYVTQLKEGNEVYKFSYETGWPPGWIFREEESFFVCQVFGVLGLFCFNSILGLAIITGLISSICSWYFYIFVKSLYEKDSKLLAFGALFVPSVGFWCSGVSKDTLVYNLVLLLIVLSFKLFKKKRRFLLNGGIIVFLSYLLISTRSIIFYSYLVPFAAIFIPGLVNLLGISRNSKLFLKFVLISGSFMLALSSIDLEQGEKEFLESSDYLMQASMTQQDFASNKSYGMNRYSLGEVNFTPIGLLEAMPIAIIYGIYSPFIWNSLSPTLILNGFESVFFIYLLLAFIFKRGRSKLTFVLNDSFLLYCFVFVIMLAFITGFTSVLYGVLVRLRCPLLPMLVLVMGIPSQSILSKKNS